MSVHRPETLRRYSHYRKKNDFVVIKYGGEWCRSCKELIPILEKLAEEYPDVYFVDADIDNDDISVHDDFKDISKVPHVKFFLGGEIKREIVGKDEEKLTRYVKRYSKIKLNTPEKKKPETPEKKKPETKKPETPEKKKRSSDRLKIGRSRKGKVKKHDSLGKNRVKKSKQKKPERFGKHVETKETINYVETMSDKFKHYLKALMDGAVPVYTKIDETETNILKTFLENMLNHIGDKETDKIIAEETDKETEEIIADKIIEEETEEQTDKETDKEIDKEIEEQTDKIIAEETGKITEEETEEQTDKIIEEQTEEQTE